MRHRLHHDSSSSSKRHRSRRHDNWRLMYILVHRVGVLHRPVLCLLLSHLRGNHVGLLLVVLGLVLDVLRLVVGVRLLLEAGCGGGADKRPRRLPRHLALDDRRLDGAHYQYSKQQLESKVDTI